MVRDDSRIMIRSILQIGGHDPEKRRGVNLRRAGRVVCDGVSTTWGDVVDASSSGMRLVARGKAIPVVGEASVLTIQGLDGPFRVVARVIWTRKRSWRRREIGVQFVEVPLESRGHLARLAEFASRATCINELDDTGFRRSA